MKKLLSTLVPFIAISFSTGIRAAQVAKRSFQCDTNRL